MTHPAVNQCESLMHTWNDPFTRVTWPIHMCDMTQSKSLQCNTYALRRMASLVTLLLICDMLTCTRENGFSRDMTHYMWHNMRWGERLLLWHYSLHDMYWREWLLLWHDSLLGTYTQENSFLWHDMTHCMCHDMTWLIVCVMTHYVKHALDRMISLVTWLIAYVSCEPCARENDFSCDMTHSVCHHSYDESICLLFWHATHGGDLTWISGSPDLTGFPWNNEDSCLLRQNFFEILGTPVKTPLKFTGTPVKTCWDVAVVMISSPISSACGLSVCAMTHIIRLCVCHDTFNKSVCRSGEGLLSMSHIVSPPWTQCVCHDTYNESVCRSGEWLLSMSRMTSPHVTWKFLYSLEGMTSLHITNHEWCYLLCMSHIMSHVTYEWAMSHTWRRRLRESQMWYDSFVCVGVLHGLIAYEHVANEWGMSHTWRGRLRESLRRYDSFVCVK